MSRSIVVLVAACLLAVGMTTPSFSQDLAGTVVDQDGHAVSGAKIITQTPDGQTIGSATSDSQGQYQIDGVNAGEYFITLAPAAAAGQGQTVASYVGNGGLTVNWAVAPGVAPVASAKAGAAGIASAGNPVSTMSFTNSVAVSDGGMCFVKSGKKYCDNGYACSVFPYGYYYCSCCRTQTIE
ncbi:MAG: carboxypeptidase-like regulatory domain-containing protein [Candidatus Binataceae bacterium]